MIILDTNIIVNLLNGKNKNELLIAVKNINNLSENSKIYTTLLCFNELTVQLGIIQARDCIRKFDINVIDGFNKKDQFPVTETLDLIFNSDEKTNIFFKQFRYENEKHISKAFSVIIQILFFTLSYAIKNTEVDDKHETELDSKNFYYITELINNLIPKFSNEMSTCYFYPDNFSRIKYLNESLSNLIKSFNYIIFLFIKCIKEQSDLANYSELFIKNNEINYNSKYEVPQKALKYIKKNRMSILNFLSSKIEKTNLKLQYQYKIELVLDYYVTGRKLKINDIVDSLLVTYIPEHYLLTFDNKLLSFIKLYNEINFNICQNLKKTYGA